MNNDNLIQFLDPLHLEFLMTFWKIISLTGDHDSSFLAYSEWVVMSLAILFLVYDNYSVNSGLPLIKIIKNSLTFHWPKTRLHWTQKTNSPLIKPVMKPQSRDGAVVENLPPMQASHQCGPGSIPKTRHQMWVEFVVGSCPCCERFFSGYSDFPLSSKKPTFLNSNSIWSSRATGLSVVLLVSHTVKCHPR